MNRRKLLTLAATAGACTAGMAALVMPASAELRTLTVTLLGGQQVVVTVDVPPGTPLDQIKIPGISTPIVSVEDSGPASTPTPEPAPSPSQTPAPSGPAPGGGSSKPSATPGGQAEQQTARPGSDRAGSKGRGSTRRRGGKANAQGGLEGVVDPLATDDGTGRRGSRAKVDRDNQGRLTDGTPTLNNPNFSLATPGAAPIGVPNFFIEKFRIPPFLLPIYQAAGIQYGVRWELLAAINEIETDYGRNLNVSSAGALGWMQFMPATWKAYGVDANRDGVKDPYNPVDAIFAAARYLRAAGAEKDVPKAVFAYNHADWYVDMVLMRARLIGGLPANLVGSLTGLTQGRFPVYAKASYADDLSEREMTKRRKRGENAAYLVESKEARRGINIYARRGAPVIAANDGKIIRIGNTKRLGRFLQLQDVYGNTFTYAHLGKIAERYPAPKPTKVTPAQVAKELKLPDADPKPTGAASGKARKVEAQAVPGKERLSARRSSSGATPAPTAPQTPASEVVEAAKERLFANPMRPNAQDAGGAQQVFEAGGDVPGVTTVQGLSRLFGLDRKDVQLKTLKVGSKVAAGTILGRIGANTRRGMAPHVLFETRPAGRGAPRIDPKPILDGWKLLESTAIYRAAGKNPFFGRDAVNPSIGQILLMSKDALAQRVINNPRIELYECGRRDIETSQIDRRVLATLEFLAASGLKPTVTSLKCGHSYLTKSGNVSHHSSGNAVDIAKVNGIPMIGNQGKGSITEITVQRLLTLQGTMKPDQIISLMKFADTDNTYAMGDHDDHIHVGWQPMYGTNAKLAKQVNAALKPEQWIKLIDRLGSIDNPTVATKPSKYSLKVKKRASHAHRGE